MTLDARVDAEPLPARSVDWRVQKYLRPILGDPQVQIDNYRLFLGIRREFYSALGTDLSQITRLLWLESPRILRQLLLPLRT